MSPVAVLLLVAGALLNLLFSSPLIFASDDSKLYKVLVAIAYRVEEDKPSVKDL